MTTRSGTPDILGNMLSPEQAERTELAQALRYDYSQLGEQATAIRDHAIEIKRNERRANDAVVESGRHLIAVKESLVHGKWMEWLEIEFHMTDRTALTLMQIARRFDGKSEIISDLNPTVLGMLAAPSVPEEAVKAMVSASSDGKVSVAQAKQIIAEHRPARLSEGDLTTIVQTWMAGFWHQPWPENPSHTNGTLWMELTAWMHENVKQPWQEGDLKTVIKRLHYEHTQQWSTPARPTPPINRPTPPATTTPDFAPVWVLEGIVGRVWSQINETNDPAQERRIALAARGDAATKQGQFWNQCKQMMGDDIRGYRHADLQQAINNVANQKEMAARAKLQAQPVASTQPAPRDRTHVLSDIRTWLYAHAGTPKEIVELGEALHYREFGHPQWDDMFPAGAENDDVYWALEQCIDEAAAKVPEYAGGVPAPAPAVFTPATVDQTVADAVDVYGEPGPALAPAGEDRRAELRAWWVRLISLRSDLGNWAVLTGRYTETLILGRELSKLLDITQSEIDALEKGVILA